jgi:hypothetical protein
MMKWNFEDGAYHKYKREQLEYPLKGPKNGVGLESVFRIKQYIKRRFNTYIFNETKPDETRNGFQLMVHDPFEVLSDDAVHLFAVTSETFNYNVVPIVSSYDETLVDFTPEERNCWLPGERKLEFFKVYNRPNCEHECLANAMLEVCSCVEFYMVRNKTTRICGAIDENCFKRVEKLFQTLKASCKCYHSCEKVKYDVKLIRTGLKK